MPASTDQITVGDIPVEIVRKKIRTMRLAVYPPAGRVRLAVPLRASDESIRRFVVTKISWIQKYQKKFASIPTPIATEYKDGETHYFLGAPCLLSVVEKKGVPCVTLPGSSRMEMQVRPGSTTAAKEKVLNEWYRARLEELLPAIIEKWEPRMRVAVAEFRIRRMKTRWGSCCIAERKICLNLELAKKSQRIIEYVVVHELIHLLERHHNARFYAYMTKFLPEWKQFKSEINREAASGEETAL